MAEIEPPAEDEGVVVVPGAVADPFEAAGTIEVLAVDDMAVIPLMRNFRTGTVKLTVLGTVDTGTCRRGCVPGIGTLGEVREPEQEEKRKGLRTTNFKKQRYKFN